METNLGKPVVMDKPDRGVELKTYSFPTASAGSDVEYYEGWVNDDRYLVPDTKLEDMKNLINAKLIITDDPKFIRRDFNKPKEEREDQYKAKLKKLSARLKNIEELGYIEKRKSQKPFKRKKPKTKRKSNVDLKSERTKTASILLDTKIDISNDTEKLPEPHPAETKKMSKLEVSKRRRRTRFPKVSNDSTNNHANHCLCFCCIWSWFKTTSYHVWKKICHCFNKSNDR